MRWREVWSAVIATGRRWWDLRAAFGHPAGRLWLPELLPEWDAYPTLRGKAAALLHSLARNHALVDGNKRLAWLATVVFLDLNGHSVEMDDDAAFALVIEVAAGTLDVQQIVERLAAG